MMNATGTAGISGFLLLPPSPTRRQDIQRLLHTLKLGRCKARQGIYFFRATLAAGLENDLMTASGRLQPLETAQFKCACYRTTACGTTHREQRTPEAGCWVLK